MPIFWLCVCSVCVILDQNKPLKRAKTPPRTVFQALASLKPRNFRLISTQFQHKTDWKRGLFVLPLRVPSPNDCHFSSFASATSQWLTLSGPTRRRSPARQRRFSCQATPLSVMPMVTASSAVEREGDTRRRFRIFSPVFWVVFWVVSPPDASWSRELTSASARENSLSVSSSCGFSGGV